MATGQLGDAVLKTGIRDADRDAVQRTHIYAAILLLTASARSTPIAAEALLMGLGDLPGGSHRSEGEAVSADGSVVVGLSYTSAGREAFRWTAGSGMTGLGELPGGPYFSRALGVSGDGTVIVGYSMPSSGREAFRWTEATGMLGLGDLDGSYSEARDVSDDGSTIVGFGSSIGPGGFPMEEAFRWTEDLGMEGLGLFPGTGAAVINSSHANAVSADGSVVVGYGMSPDIYLEDAFLWSEASGMVPLPAAPQSMPLNIAVDVSADGSVVVGHIARPAGDEPFRWTASGAMVGIGGLPGSVVRGEARATSGDGSVVVGYAYDSSGDRQAFIWDASSGMRSIADFLSVEHGLDVDGWRLDDARGISNDGNVIVGSGLSPQGNLEAWMIVVPEPSAVPAAALSFAALATLLGCARSGVTRDRQSSANPPGAI